MQSKSKSGLKSLVELVVTVAVAVGFALLIQAFVVKPYRIPSVSMEPTLTVGQRVLANRLIDHPSVGDVVVFHPPVGADPMVCGNHAQGEGHAQPCDTPTPGESSQTFIKRVVAGPGDRLSIVNGHAIRQRQARARPLHQAMRRRWFLQFPENDHDSARPLLHDG